jgi:hypothetical protein
MTLLTEAHETIATLLQADSYRMQALHRAAELDLPDWCLAAGFVRNLVWDYLHQKTAPTPLNDLDLIYFNSEARSESVDREIEALLKSSSNHPWSVKNQARMHLRNNDQPYTCTTDAMSYWVEVETAVGARLDKDGNIKLIAPFGFASLMAGEITLNPKRPKPDAFTERVTTKKWLTLWPKLVCSQIPAL